MRAEMKEALALGVAAGVTAWTLEQAARALRRGSVYESPDTERDKTDTESKPRATDLAAGRAEAERLAGLSDDELIAEAAANG